MLHPSPQRVHRLQGRLTYILTLAFAAPDLFELVIIALFAATHHLPPQHPCPLHFYPLSHFECSVVPLPVSGETRLTTDRISPTEGAQSGAKYREMHRVVPSGSEVMYRATCDLLTAQDQSNDVAALHATV